MTKCVLLAKLYKPLPCFILYSKAKFACYSRCFLTSYFFTPIPYNEKDIFWRCFWVLVLEGLADFHRTVQIQILQHSQLGHRLGLLCIECFALEMNRDHSVIFETASKQCILVSVVDYDGCSISSKEFFPTVVDIMFILVKFTHSCPFQFSDS